MIAEQAQQQSAWTWWVPGTPKPQPRGRAFARKMGDGTYRARVHNPGTAEAWKGQIAVTLGQPRAPIEGPVFLGLDFYIQRPKDMLRKKDPDGPVLHTKLGDVDNFAKAAMDALTQLGWWRDDAQVCRLLVTKQFCSKTGAPGAFIRIEEMAP